MTRWRLSRRRMDRSSRKSTVRLVRTPASPRRASLNSRFWPVGALVSPGLRRGWAAAPRYSTTVSGAPLVGNTSLREALA